jgi:hypothetical protein
MKALRILTTEGQRDQTGHAAIKTLGEFYPKYSIGGSLTGPNSHL